MSNKKNFNYRALVFNPFVVVIYGIGCYLLALLAKYGGIEKRLPFILITFLSLFLWFIGCLYRYMLKINEDHPKEKSTIPLLNSFSKGMFLLSMTSLIAVTFATGTSIYHSGTNFQGRLAFVIDDVFNHRKVTFTHDNLYKDNLEGLFDDLEAKIDLPTDLYISNHFELTFNKEGQITSFYSHLYGLDDTGKKKTFLLNYDRSKDSSIFVTLNRETDSTFDETMKLQPLLDGVKHIPIKKTVNDWNNDTLGLYYTGYRNWEKNVNSIVYFDKSGTTFSIETTENDITGYSISVYIPDDPSMMPVRFIDYSLVSHSLQTKVTTAEPENESSQDEDETYYVNKQTGYQLSVADAALGSRFYILNRTTDEGKNWEMINADPFLGSSGVSSGITFINEELGFIGLSHSGSTYSDLYRTTDAGLTFEKLTFPSVEVLVTDTEKSTPFDSPEMPYEENGALFTLIAQGEDGDYNGGVKALYRSNNDGKTWEYIAEIKQAN